MEKSKVKMPEEINQKCHLVIHAAAVAAGGAAVIPIPVADAIPIGAAQVTMIVGLGKVFDITISESLAKAILNCGIVQNIGRALVGGILKVMPGLGWVLNAGIAASLTEALGWIVADDFYRLSIGEKPENILEQAEKVKELFLHSGK